MEQPYCSAKKFHFQNADTSCLYFDIIFPGITPENSNVILKILKVVLKKLAKIVPLKVVTIELVL